MGKPNALLLDQGDADYRDTGCDLHPACLSCPFSRCRHEMHPGQARKELTMLALDERLRAGLTVTAAAHALGISPRSAYRLRAALGRAGEGGAS